MTKLFKKPILSVFIFFNDKSKKIRYNKIKDMANEKNKKWIQNINISVCICHADESPFFCSIFKSLI